MPAYFKNTRKYTVPKEYGVANHNPPIPTYYATTRLAYQILRNLMNENSVGIGILIYAAQTKASWHIKLTLTWITRMKNVGGI